MEKYTFFNDVDDDRIYFAEDFARHLATYFTNGVFNNGCKVFSENDDMSVNVNIGSANINGYRYDNDAIKVLNIDNADGVLNRIDNIVIRWDLTNRIITAQVIKGTFAEKPIAPDLVRTSTMYDLRIAKVSVPAGTTTITTDLITDTRFKTSDCGNVISTVQTPNTEELFIQFEKIFNNTINSMNGDFDEWFNKIKNQLSTDAAGNLQMEIDEIEKQLEEINGGVTGDTLPIGSVVSYSKSKAPTNWLICDGSAVSRTTYSELFKVIGIIYGEGDGSTTFNLPLLIESDDESTIIEYKIIKAKNSVGLVGAVSDVYSESTQDSYSCNYINNILTKSYITVRLSENKSSGDTPLKFDIVSPATNSNIFELQSDGKIKIKRNCTLKVNANIRYGYSTAATKNPILYKNDEIILTASIQQATATTISLTPFLMDVNAGDTLYLVATSSASCAIIADCTYLTLEEK